MLALNTRCFTTVGMWSGWIQLQPLHTGTRSNLQYPSTFSFWMCHCSLHFKIWKCDGLDYNDEYIGKSSRTYGEMYNEHLWAPLPINGHHITTDYLTNMDNISIIGGHGFARTTKQYMQIRVNNPTSTRNIGKYNLPHIWDGVMANTSELRIKH